MPTLQLIHPAPNLAHQPGLSIYANKRRGKVTNLWDCLKMKEILNIWTLLERNEAQTPLWLSEVSSSLAQSEMGIKRIVFWISDDFYMNFFCVSSRWQSKDVDRFCSSLFIAKLLWKSVHRILVRKWRIFDSSVKTTDSALFHGWNFKPNVLIHHEKLTYFPNFHTETR